MFAQLLKDPEPTWPFWKKEPDWSAQSVAPKVGTPYGRRILHASPDGEVLLLQWAAGIATAPHDHGGASGWVRVLRGQLEEQRYSRQGQDLHALGWRPLAAGTVSQVRDADVHAMRSTGPSLSLHVYRPMALRGMRLFPEQGPLVELGPGCGAWWPTC